MFPAPPYWRQELRQLCLRRAALDRLISSPEEYSFVTRREREEPLIRRFNEPEERILRRPVRPCQTSKPISIGKTA
jgi:hypothetical protein